MAWSLRPKNLGLICTWTVVASQAINAGKAKRNYSEFLKNAEDRISILQNAIDKIQKGKKVDLAKELGTGNEQDEKAWKNLFDGIIKGYELKNPRLKKRSPYDGPLL